MSGDEIQLDVPEAFPLWQVPGMIKAQVAEWP